MQNNRIKNAFDIIDASDALKASTREFIATKRASDKTINKSRRFKYAMSAVCSMAVLIVGIGMYSFMINTPVSYVSIDVNPSIELTLNRLDRVIDVKGYNDDGKKILKELDLKGKTYEDSVDVIMGSEAMKDYLTDDFQLTFTVASSSESREKEILTGIKSCSSCSGHKYSSYGADVGEIQEAHDHGLSLGKYNAYLKLHQYDESVTPEDCQDMTMGEIHSLINDHEVHEGGGGNCNEGVSSSKGHANSGNSNNSVDSNSGSSNSSSGNGEHHEHGHSEHDEHDEHE